MDQTFISTVPDAAAGHEKKLKAKAKTSVPADAPVNEAVEALECINDLRIENPKMK